MKLFSSNFLLTSTMNYIQTTFGNVFSSISMNGSMITMNGKTHGKKVTKFEVHLDGEVLEFPIDQKLMIDIKADHIDRVDSQTASVNVTGNVGNVNTQTGPVNVSGNIEGSCSTQTGSIKAKEIYGNCSSMVGNISRR